MNTAIGRAARRELAVVVGLASAGIALVLLVAFAPWYEPVIAGTRGASVVETNPPAVQVVDGSRSGAMIDMLQPGAAVAILVDAGTAAGR
jgi:hypothetical protein